MNTVAIPTLSDDDVANRLFDALNNGTPLSEITVDSILGVSEDELQEVAPVVSTGPSEEFVAFLEALEEGSGQVYCSAQRRVIFVRNMSAANLQKRISSSVVDALESVARDLNQPLLVAELTTRGELPTEFPPIPDEFISVTIPACNLLTVGIRGRCDVAAYSPFKLSPEDSAFADADDVVISNKTIAYVTGQRTIRLRFNPFCGTNNKISIENPERRVQSLKTVLTTAWPSLETASVNSVDSANPNAVRNLRNQAETLRMLPRIADFSVARTDDLQDNLEGQLSALDRAVNQLRDQLVAKLREHQSKAAELDQARNQDVIINTEDTIEIYKQIIQIKKLSGVRSVEIVGTVEPLLKVVLHPYVIALGRGKRSLLDCLGFTLSIRGGNHIEIKWLYFTQDQPNTTNPRANSPHPHVSTAGSTCWGEAQTPLNNAVSHKNWFETVFLILGWAIAYNSRSPHVGASYWEPSQLPIGWHPEIESRVR